MRGVVLVLVSILFFVPLERAHAVFYNDSNVIEIGDGLPPEPEETEEGEEGGGSGSEDPGNSEEEESNQGDTGGSGSQGSSGGSSGGSSSSGSSGSSNSETEDEEELVDLLLSEGAVGIENGNGSLGTSDTLGDFGSDSVLAVTVSGAKVRSALRGNYDLQDVLERWSSKKKGKYGSKEYGLIAASTALRDANIESVSFTASAFEITYRSRGYLLAVIPWSFPVRVNIIAEAQALEERIKITLPWYRFFVREFFTINGLRDEINTVIETTQESNSDPNADGNALLFTAISDFLRHKIGTVGGTILLES